MLTNAKVLTLAFPQTLFSRYRKVYESLWTTATLSTNSCQKYSPAVLFQTRKIEHAEWRRLFWRV